MSTFTDVSQRIWGNLQSDNLPLSTRTRDPHAF